MMQSGQMWSVSQILLYVTGPKECSWGVGLDEMCEPVDFSSHAIDSELQKRIN